MNMSVLGLFSITLDTTLTLLPNRNAEFSSLVQLVGSFLDTVCKNLNNAIQGRQWRGGGRGGPPRGWQNRRHRWVAATRRITKGQLISEEFFLAFKYSKKFLS